MSQDADWTGPRRTSDLGGGLAALRAADLDVDAAVDSGALSFPTV